MILSIKLLTTGVDKGAAFTGTDKADTFTASLTTVNDGDELDGGAGIDTLNLEINANVSDKFKSANIEKVVVTAFGDRSVDTKNFTGMDTFTTKGSTGVLTLDKLASAATAFGFEGTGSNSITANFVAGALSGANDVLNISLNAAKAVTLVTQPGFESAKIVATGANDLTTLTATGVKVISIEGGGSLNARGQFTSISTLNATKMVGALTTGTADAVTGLAGSDITADVLGATILLGAGNDNISFVNTSSTGVSTIRLGDGNDKLKLNAAGNGAVAVFGDAGDDTISAITTALTSNDLIDGGVGNDTLILSGALTNNAMAIRGIENVKITAGTEVQTFTNDDSASIITFVSADDSAVALAGLAAGSTVTVTKAGSFVTGALAGLDVGFRNVEASSTINVGAALDGALAVSKIGTATFSFADTVSGSVTLITTDTPNLVIAADKAFGRSTIAASDDKLKSLTITSQDAVATTTIGAATTDKLESVTISGKSVAVTSIGQDSAKLSKVSLVATNGALTADAIGHVSTNTDILNVALTSTGNLAGTGTAASSLIIGSAKLGDVSAISSTGTVLLGAIGSTASQIGNVTISGKGDVKLGLIGHATAVATQSGTISVSSTDGLVGLEDTLSIHTKVATGLNVSLTAKTTIGNDAGDGTNVAVIQNTDGNINATLAGDAKAIINFTAVDKGVVSLNASNKGGLVSTLTQVGTIGDGSVSTVQLGIAKSGESNALTVTGIVDTLNITGGSGKDSVVLATAQSLKSGTIALGAGADVLSFAGTTGGSDQGIAINLGSTTVTFSDTGSTTVAAGKAVGFLSTSTSSKVVTGNNGFELTVSGISEVVGTARADHIVANAEGTIITGGNEADRIVLGAGKDVVKFVGTTFANMTLEGNDVIQNFTSGSDVIQFASGLLLGNSGTGTVAVTINATGATKVVAITDGASLIGETTGAVTDGAIFQVAATNDVTGEMNATNVAVFLDGITVGSVQQSFFAVDNGSDTFIWFFANTATNTATVDAAELTLVAQLVGITALASGDFGLLS